MYTQQQEPNQAEMLKFEQVKQLISTMPASIIGLVASAFIIVFLEWHVVDQGLLLGWLGFALTIATVRVFIFSKFRQINSVFLAVTRCRNYISISIILTGVVWATASILLFPRDDIFHQTILAFVLAGNAAGAAVTLSAIRPLVISFLFLVLTPIAIQFLLIGEEHTTAMAILIAVFLALMLMAGLSVQRNIEENIMLKLESLERERLLTESQQASKKSEQTYYGIFNNLQEAICIQNEDGIFLDVNEGAIRMYGYPRERFIGQKLPFLLSSTQNDIKIIDQSFEEALSGEAQQFECWGLDVDGREFQKDLRLYSGRYFGQKAVIGIAQDISEKKQLETQFIQSQKMEAIGTLVGGIAHDFNNTLAAMQGNIYLARTQAGNSWLVGDKLSNIERLSNHAAETVQQLLTFARKAIVNTHDFSMLVLLQESLKLSDNIIPENIHFKSLLSDEDLVINGDQTQLQQILINLLNNATHAVEQAVNPEIICSLAPFIADAAFQLKYPDIKTKHFAYMCISDNGHGIDGATLPHIFDPFFTTKEVGEGTGLGLAMVYGSVQTHHGLIDVTSTPGKGTSVHIYLPLISTKSSKKTLGTNSEAITKGHGEVILLVDDEETLLTTIKEVLENIGYNVLTATNGEEAIEIFSQNTESISLLVIDVVMPKLGGFEAAQVIRDVKEIPVIFTTGYDKENILEKLPEDDNHIILTKPVALDKLSQSIQGMLS